MTNTDRTTILVAHRLSTLRDSDRIFVFDEGRIVEVGSYDDLVKAGGVFAELVMSAEFGVSPEASPGIGGAFTGPRLAVVGQAVEAGVAEPVLTPVAPAGLKPASGQ